MVWNSDEPISKCSYQKWQSGTPSVLPRSDPISLFMWLYTLDHCQQIYDAEGTHEWPHPILPPLCNSQTQALSDGLQDVICLNVLIHCSQCFYNTYSTWCQDLSFSEKGSEKPWGSRSVNTVYKHCNEPVLLTKTTSRVCSGISVFKYQYLASWPFILLGDSGLHLFEMAVEFWENMFKELSFPWLGILLIWCIAKIDKIFCYDF